MHELGRIARRNGLRHTIRSQHGGEGEVTARQRLAYAQDVGRDAGPLAGKHAARAAEPGRDFVGDQQDAVTVARLAQAAQVLRVVKPHAARTLHDGFEDHGRQRVVVALE